MATTEENHQDAFAGESQARNKYTFFAQVAREEGYHYIAKIFEETADNERRHAKDHLKRLNGIGDTAANLQAAIDGENFETTEMYPQMAEDADKEGNRASAVLFRQIAAVEAHHRDRYQALLDLLESGAVFKRDTPIKWKCGVCGHIHEGKEPPKKCLCCMHDRQYFEPASLDV